MISTENFIRKAKLIHGDKYDYTSTIYTNAKTPVTIICSKHGEFLQNPRSHLTGNNCKRCKSNIKLRVVRKLERKFKDLVQPEDYKLIPLSSGKFTKVDNEDFDRLKDINWHLGNRCARSKVVGSMHRYIMNPSDDMVVDHINGDWLDNRKSNLRICTQRENSRNSMKRKEGLSKYKGIYRHKGLDKWVARISCNHRQYYLGCFKTEEEAGRAYDKKALELFGEFAWLNFK